MVAPSGTVVALAAVRGLTAPFCLPQILDEVEKRRQISMAVIYPFMQGLRESPFPAPGKTVTIKSFIPESGTEVGGLQGAQHLLVCSNCPLEHPPYLQHPWVLPGAVGQAGGGFMPWEMWVSPPFSPRRRAASGEDEEEEEE